ncbi:Exportin-2 [Chytridiales sp. JEL 0842]|nr:Exportin-2 [Chytridiales sp. JEL 0842]
MDASELSILQQRSDHHHLDLSSSCSSDDNDVECHQDTAAVDHDEPECSSSGVLRLRGGKGGFGSMLRAQGGRMNSKKTTNFESCRDLSGRRLKTINDAKKLADFIAKEPERKQKKLEETQAKIEEGLKEKEEKKIRFDDTQFLNDHEKILDSVKDSVAKAMKSKKKAPISQKAKPSEKKEKEKISKKKAAWPLKEHCRQKTMCLGQLDPYFVNFMRGVIILESIFIGVETEMEPQKSQFWSLFQFITILHNFSVIVYFIEVALKWTDSWENYWKDGWNVADFVVTSVSAAAELTELIGGTNSMFLIRYRETINILRILRILKIIFRFENLKIIIMTILQAFESMAYIMLLVAIVSFIYAVIAVFLYRPYTFSPDAHESLQKNFANIGTSLQTLFQLLTLDAWDPVNRDLYKVVDPVWSQIYIISWCWLGAFIFRNIFIGVMVNNFDKISDTLKEQEAEYIKAKQFEKMRKKLNKELAVQGNIQRSITNLKAGADGIGSEASLNNDTSSTAPQQKPNGKDTDVLQTIQKLLVASHGISKGWESTVAETLTVLADSKAETMWPRDSLFQYLQLMENLQENMKEYEELQLLCTESALASIELSQTFPLQLLQVVQSSTLDPHVRFASAVYFKNYCKKYWKQVDGEQDKVAASDRVAVKGAIVDLMIVAPSSIQLQLSEAVSIIADNDFPASWTNLVGELVNKLNVENYSVNIGVLQTAHSIFKRWRHQFRSDALFTEIKMVLDVFAEPFLQFFLATDNLIDANASNKQVLDILFNCLLLLTKIFYSLNCQDLPEFFENHQDQFMALFMKYLKYDNASLKSDDDDEPGLLDKVKTSICEVIMLYGSKYEEDFTALPQFVEAVWGLLTCTGLQQKYDELVSKAISFLTAVVKPSRHKPMFQNPEILQSICEKIILPNMNLRESDEELFEDEPMEFVRREIEGSEEGTRRRAAAELIRGLLEHFAQEITSILSGYLNVYLSTYEKDKSANWKAKDAALYLITAVSARSLSLQSGALRTNEYIETLPVFITHVLPDLQAPVDGAVKPIIKVDALKYLAIFRSQLSKAQLLNVIPLVANHLTSSNFVVYTFAAMCLEKILTIKTGASFLITKEDIRPYSTQMIMSLFDLVGRNSSTPEKLAENDYLMKAIARAVMTAQDDCLPSATDILTRLTKIIEAISRNPSNPKFNHFVFETLGALIRYICASDASLVGQFEQLLFPPFQAILQQDVAEFMPYVFQLLSQMLIIHKESGIPQVYEQMLPALLQPAVWESHGNIPALVSLMEAYLSKGAEKIAQGGHLTPILGVYQKLIASRMNDVKTPKFTKGFLKFISFLFTMEKDGLSVDAIIGVFDSIQPHLFRNLLQAIIIPELSEVLAPEERKLCGVGIAKLLTSSNTMLNDPYITLWPNLHSALSGVLDVPLAENGSAAQDETYTQDIEEAGYQVTFARLSSIGRTKKDNLAAIPDPKAFYHQRLAILKQSPAASRLPPIQVQVEAQFMEMDEVRDYDEQPVTDSPTLLNQLKNGWKRSDITSKAVQDKYIQITQGKNPLFTVQDKAPEYGDADVMSDSDEF